MPTRSWVILLALVCLVAPACSDNGSSYQPCTTDGDCSAGFVCEAGECREAPGCSSDDDCKGGRVCLDGICQEPEAECTQDSECPDKHKCENDTCVEVDCREDADCEEGFYCDDYACVADECVTDADCAPSEICEAGRCKPRETTPCSEDSECRQDELCIEDECQVPPACADDGECPSGTVCENGRCARPCASDAECGQFYVCRAGHCLQQCLNDATCQAAGTICVDGVCVAAECTTDDDCTEELTRCMSGRCQTYTPCTDDADCEANFVCTDSICEELPTCSIDDNCVGDRCANPPCECFDGHCHEVPRCDTEADCPDDRDCIGGVCLTHVCRGDADCDAGQACVGGVCIDAGDPGSVTEVIILTPGGPIYEGQQMQLVAIALTANGQEVPNIPFDWDSSEPDRAAVGATGMLTGGSQAGATDVTATAQGTAVTSDPVTFTNILDVPADTLRITVVDAATRLPVEGAAVVLDAGAAPETQTSAADGTATFTDPQAAVDIHVFSDAHDYVSIIQTASVDILVPVAPRSDPSKTGGYTGQMTFPGTGAVELGLSGTSFGGSLVDLNFGTLLGDMFTVTVSTPMGAFNITLPAPMVMGANLQGMPFPIKDTYYVEGQSGARTAWGMGGNLDMSVLFDIAGSGGSPGEILLGLLPYFAVFDHGLQPAMTVFSMARVQDTDDIDGDGDVAEMRPDWANFQDIDLTPSQPQSLALYLETPDLPSHGGTPIPAAVFIAGAQTPQGMTPLGLTAAEATDGVVLPITMRMAPPYGGLEVGRYAVVILGIPTTGGMEIPADVAMVIHTAADLVPDLTFASGFLAFPEDASFSTADRQMVATGIAGATLFRSTIRGDLGTWEVYLANVDGAVGYTLPAPPTGMDDLAAGTTVTMDPVTLGDAMTYEDLIGFNGDDLDQLNRLMTACTRYELP